MLFSDEFIRQVENDPISGIVDACDLMKAALRDASTGDEHWNEYEHEVLWETAAFLNAVLEQENISLSIGLPEPTGDVAINCRNTNEYIRTVHDYFKEKSVLLKVESYTGKYRASLKSSFAYEFSQGDLDRVQVLINELREQIKEQGSLEQEHKQRLLRRLEKLQSELHKRVSDLDRFWGLIGDAGVVLGKLGKDAKPIVDRTREIAEIIWKTQARSEELPSDSQNPMIEHDR